MPKPGRPDRHSNKRIVAAGTQKKEKSVRSTADQSAVGLRPDTSYMHTTDLNVFLRRAYMHTTEFHEMRFWPRDEHTSMYAISLLKQVVVVLSKSEGLQKWMAPCGTDMHRVARTINDYFLKKDSHRPKRKENVKRGIKSTRKGKFGRNIYLFA
jgi:hypothetical protein